MLRLNPANSVPRTHEGDKAEKEESDSEESEDVDAAASEKKERALNRWKDLLVAIAKSSDALRMAVDAVPPHPDAPTAEADQGDRPPDATTPG